MACRTCSIRPNRKLRHVSQKQQDKISELSNKINEVQNDLETALGLYNTELASLDDTKMKIKKKIVHLKTYVIKLLDDFESATLESMEQNIVYFKSEIAHKFKQSKDDLIMYKNMLDEIKTNRQFDEAKLTNTQTILTQTREFIDNIKYGQINIEFKPDVKILQMESDVKSIGSISVNMKRNPNKPYVLKSVEEICPGSDKDITTCSITGICSLPNGDVMMADSCNKKLTRLSKDSLTQKGSLRFLSNPWDVCATRLHEVAVTFPEESKNVRFISTANSLQRTRSLKLRHICRGIDYFEEELFVTDQGIFLYVYTIDGTLLRKFPRDTSNQMLSDYRTLSVSKHLIILTDWDDGITAFDRQGKLVWKYHDAITKRASGACFDGDGNIFICCSQSINVVQIDKNGKVIGAIAGTKEGLVYPTSICFDTERSVIVIGQQEAKCIKLKVV